MKVNFAYKGMEHSEFLENYAEKKLSDALENFNLETLKVELSIVLVKHTITLHLHLVTSDGRVFELSEEGNDAYGCIDQLQGKVKRQLRKSKEKDISKKVKAYKEFSTHQDEKQEISEDVEESVTI